MKVDPTKVYLMKRVSKRAWDLIHNCGFNCDPFELSSNNLDIFPCPECVLQQCKNANQEKTQEDLRQFYLKKLSEIVSK